MAAKRKKIELRFTGIKPDFDEKGKIINKEKLIEAEEKRLKKSYEGLSADHMQAAETLIPSVAFMSVSMLELEKILNLKGYVETYQNGANQIGIKKASEIEIYNNLAKNLLSYTKQLDDMLAKDSSGKDKDGDKLMDFLSGG